LEDMKKLWPASIASCSNKSRQKATAGKNAQQHAVGGHEKAVACVQCLLQQHKGMMRRVTEWHCEERQTCQHAQVLATSLSVNMPARFGSSRDAVEPAHHRIHTY
jgi:hypothetical protein